MTEEIKDRINNSVQGYWFCKWTSKKRMANAWWWSSAMQLMLAGKVRGYDTVPMFGYSIEEFRKEI